MREEGTLRLQVHIHFICSSGRTLPGHGMCRLQPLLTATPVEGQAAVLFPGCVGRSLPVVCAHTRFRFKPRLWQGEAINRQVAARIIVSNHVGGGVDYMFFEAEFC